MDGVINIYKEKGYTSHDVVMVVRKVLNTKKVGHTGTLDPDATGILPICVGKATKLSDYIMSERKTYETTVTLGVETTTQDHTGEVTSTGVVSFDEKSITNTVNSFIGKSEQIPPMYSAIKVGGKKLYELARKGEEIERKPRPIEIFDIKILELMPPNKFSIEVTCSKGTYIRSLCHDIGKKLGCGAHMSSLVRTKTGIFEISESITLDKLKELSTTDKLDEFLIPITKILNKFSRVYVDEKAKKLLHNGGTILERYFKCDNKLRSDEIVLAFDSDDLFVGIYKAVNDNIKNIVVIEPIKILI